MRRKPPSREIKPRILIVTEGESEEKYFKALKSKLFRKMSIEIIKGSSSDPKHVLKTAKLEISNSKSNQYTYAYAVIDRESPNSNRKNIEEALKDSKIKVKGGILCDLLISNPSFEFWLLLHFNFSTKSFLNSRQVESELKKYIKDYEKPYDYTNIMGKNNKNDLDNTLNTAISNAKKVNAYHIKNQTADKLSHNPSSDIYLLIEKLLELQSI